MCRTPACTKSLRCRQYVRIAGKGSRRKGLDGITAQHRLAKMPCTNYDLDVVVSGGGLEIAMFARRSTFAVLLLSCLACWLSCTIMFGEIPELLSLTDNASNDFTVRKAASTEGVHVLSVEKQDAIRILTRAVEHVASELLTSTFQDTTPTDSALFIVNSVLRR